jgi:hypothetical protein
MSTKPTAVAEFASGAAIIVEPEAGRKGTGWEYGEYPPAEEFNWLFYYSWLWQKYLYDAAFQGQQTHRSTTEDTFVPLIVGLDPSNSSRRATIDHNGFRGGWVVEGQQNWMTSGTSDPEGFFADALVGTASIAYSGPTGLFPVRHALLTTGATNPSSLYVRSLEAAWMDADRTFFMEGMVMLNYGLTRGDLRWGLWEQSTGYGWWFRMRPSDNTDIECFTVGSTGTIDEYDTNVAIVTTTIFRLRLEVCGANNHDGTDGLVRFFINGTLVREFNFSNPTLARAVEMYTYLSNTDANSVIANIGPIRWGFNQLAAPDNL